MPTLRFRRVLDRMLSPMLSFREIRHALFMMVFALIPWLSVFAVFEVFLTKNAIAPMCRTDRSAVTGHDLAPLFNYYISWVAHVLVSVGVGVGATRSAFRNTSPVKKTALKRFGILAFLVTILVVIVGDDMHSNLAVLSHDRVFNVLSVAPSLSPMFQQELNSTRYTISVPTIFSFFPIVGIAAAFWATSTIILCASKFLVEFERVDDGDEPNDRIAAFTDALEALRSHFLALSLVLVTSTLGTIAFLRIPLGLLSVAERHSFKVTSDAVGLVWGVTFSLTLLALCVYPFSVLRKHFDSLSKYAHDTNGEVLGRWLRKNRVLLQVPANLQLVLYMLSPATFAVLANLVST
jgi:hypothetical protein